MTARGCRFEAWRRGLLPDHRPSRGELYLAALLAVDPPPAYPLRLPGGHVVMAFR